MHIMPDGRIFADIGLRAESADLRKKIGLQTGRAFFAFQKENRLQSSARLPASLHLLFKPSRKGAVDSSDITIQ